MTVLICKKHNSMEIQRMGKTGSNQRHIRHFYTQLKDVIPFTAPVEGRAVRLPSFLLQNFYLLD